LGILFNLLSLPALGAPKMAHWLAKTVVEAAEQEALDEGRVRGELTELQERLDAGEIVEEEYDRLERDLLERLNAIRELKAQQGSPQ